MGGGKVVELKTELARLYDTKSDIKNQLYLYYQWTTGNWDRNKTRKDWNYDIRRNRKNIFALEKEEYITYKPNKCSIYI